MATGVTTTATVVIKTNSENNEEFAFRIRGRGGYKIGDTGPGGGMIFYAIGDEFKECTKTDLGGNNYNWYDSTNMAANYQGNGFTDWRLPDNTELNSMYQNLHRNSLGGFSGNQYYYWSSIEYDTTSAYAFYFYNGTQSSWTKSYSYYSTGTIRNFRARAVRSFTF
jgi:hypothetical protein